MRVRLHPCPCLSPGRWLGLGLALILLLPTAADAGLAAVVSQHTLATKSGIKILKSGGNAADAAIAAAFTLAVVEPHSSGLGGGGFLLYFDKAANTVTFVDYREAAPGALTHANYRKRLKGDPQASETGPLAIAVPGFTAGMHKIHEEFGGGLPWGALLDDAIRHATNGVPMLRLMRKRLEGERRRLSALASFQELFVRPAAGKKPFLLQPKLATTLIRIQAGGAREFYRGDLAKQIVKDLKGAGSPITTTDLATYRVYFSKPHRFVFQDQVIYSAPLPSTGGLLLQHLLLAARAAGMQSDAPGFAAFLETELGKYFEDRKKLGDRRAKLFASTSHLCVVDGNGNIAAMTNTINLPFGSGVVLESSGILMNDEMDDFDLTSGDAKNAITRGNRPLSSMSPTIVFKAFDPLIVIGTPGGLTIPMNLYQVLQRVLSEGEGMAQAIRAPKFYAFPHQKKSVYEEGLDPEALKNLKVKAQESERPIGNVQAIVFSGRSPRTFSDPRGEGAGRSLSVR